MAIKALTKQNKGKEKEIKVPSKRTMNFIHHQSSFNPKRMVPVILVLVILAAVFVKFGILDLTSKKIAAYEELSSKQMQLASLNKGLSGYDEVFYQYGRYSYGWMNETETNMLSRMDVLKLVEERISPNCIIENLAVNDNVLTMNIHGLTLKQASAMVKNLEKSPMVESALVYNAVAEEAAEANIFLSINMTKEDQ